MRSVFKLGQYVEIRILRRYMETVLGTIWSFFCAKIFAILLFFDQVQVVHENQQY